jgi:eukaryotic-like serine/threonine-protein kinase
MSVVPRGTQDQTPEERDALARHLARSFAPGDAVPGLSSWLLERRLGVGGFGEVWLARHKWDTDQKPRAVKFCTDPEAKHRLVTHEQNVVVRVMKYAGKHPNIVPLLDCNLDGELPWLMYEFVEGGTLAALIEQARELQLSERIVRAVRVLHAMSGALAAMHRLNPPIVHRDLKPQNVLMAGAVPRITDFGIGSVALPDKQGATTGAYTASAARIPSALKGAGTRLYAPPEQMLGAPPNPRDDVYALGIIAYQLVLGDLTAAPGTDATLELNDLKVPSELTNLIVRSVAMNADRRPKDAGEWETALSAIIRRAPTTVPRERLVVPPPLPAPLPLPPQPITVIPAQARRPSDQGSQESTYADESGISPQEGDSEGEIVLEELNNELPTAPFQWLTFPRFVIIAACTLQGCDLFLRIGGETFLGKWQDQNPPFWTYVVVQTIAALLAHRAVRHENWAIVRFAGYWLTHALIASALTLPMSLYARDEHFISRYVFTFSSIVAGVVLGWVCAVFHLPPPRRLTPSSPASSP